MHIALVIVAVAVVGAAVWYFMTKKQPLPTVTPTKKPDPGNNNK